MRPTPIDVARNARDAALLGLLFFAISFFSVELMRDATRIAPLWPANAVTLALLIRARRLRNPFSMPSVLLANLLANLLGGDPLPVAFGLSLANSVEIALAWWLVRRFCTLPIDFTDLYQLRNLLISCAVAAPVVSSLIATLTLSASSVEPWWYSPLKWWVTDGLGMLLLLPGILILSGPELGRWLDHRSIARAFGLFAFGVALVSAVFIQSNMPLLFLVIPIVVIHAYIDGPVGTALSTVKVAVLVTAFTSAGQGPIMLIEDPWLRIVVLQLFLATLLMTGLPLASAIEAQRRAVRKLAQREIELMEKTIQAEHAAQAKNRFLANMSHELRTPMNGVLGFAELLAGQAGDQLQRKRASLIVESGRAMLRLLNDILDISKVEAGNLVLENAEMRLEHLCQRCVSLNQTLAARKGLQLVSWVDPLLPEAIVADPLRIQQILDNLIGNAIKFTPSGLVTLSVRQAGSMVHFSVIDTGIGIEPDRINAIFLRFEQGDDSTTRKYGGSGLGLSLSLEFARLMGGTLTVSSTPGVGSEFILELPCIPATELGAQASLANDPGPVRPLRHSRILLAEDHEVNQELMRDMLEQLSQTVVVVSDGEEAVAAVRDAQSEGQAFDLVLMDIQMPVCDGYGATSRIRDMGIGPDRLPIVAITANAFVEDVERARSAGMQGHLAKPVTLARLREAIERHLGPERVGPLEPEKHKAGNLPASLISPRLREMWRNNRAAAIVALVDYLETGAADSAARLAADMHKIAGTAALLGEAEFGSLARALETAIRTDAPAEDIRQIGEAILAAIKPDEGRLKQSNRG